MITMRLMSKEVALTTPSRIANNSASRAVARPAGALDDDTCSPSLQKWATETACMFLGEIILASVATTSVMDQKRPHDKVGQGRQTGVCECAHWSGHRGGKGAFAFPSQDRPSSEPP